MFKQFQVLGTLLLVNTRKVEKDAAENPVNHTFCVRVRVLLKKPAQNNRKSFLNLFFSNW